MSNQWAGWPEVGVAAAVAVLVVLAFRASCPLADVEPGEFKGVALPLVAVAVCLPLAWWLARPAPGDPARAALGVAAAGLAAWAVPALLYGLLLPLHWRKAALVSGLQFVLAALVGALVAGVALVALAAVQLTRTVPRGGA